MHRSQYYLPTEDEKLQVHHKVQSAARVCYLATSIRMERDLVSSHHKQRDDEMPR
jgi:hypothetical protein